MTSADEVSRLRSALPFWLSLGMIPMAILGATRGGWTVVLLPVYGWVSVTVLDAILGLNEENPETETPETSLFWYRFITIIWFPIQVVTIYGMIWWVTHTGHLSALEIIVLFFGVGVISGTVGIVYSHELLHQRNRLERWLGDLLLATVLYSHFRTEHLLVHHRYVGTPRDAVTARYNEGFHRYFFRVLRECPVSAWRAEVQMLARASRGPWHRSNPFWRYGLLQLAALALAWGIGGWLGLALFVWQAFIAVWQLELTNYVEHYGLTRKYLGDGEIRTCPAAPQLERRAQGLELAADQPPAPLRPPLQARPPLSAVADLFRGRGAAAALRLSGNDHARHDPAAVAAADEPEGPGLAAEILSRDHRLGALQHGPAPAAARRRLT